MPLYEYECSACHKHTEKIQKFSDKEITECPFCGGKLQRVISAPAIAFKGGGWFKDGYGNAKPAVSNSSEGSSSGDTPSPAKDSTTPSGDTASSSSTPAPATTPAPAAAPAASTSSDKN
jgi:putative FmdB family regulatory protein